MMRGLVWWVLIAGVGAGCEESSSTTVQTEMNADAATIDAEPTVDMMSTTDMNPAVDELDAAPSPADGAAQGTDATSPDDARVPSAMDATPMADDATPPAPDGAPPVPDAAAPMPDAAAPMPDAAAPMPDAGQGDPCDNRLACLNFEGVGLGVPEVPGWNVVSPNCSGEGRITIEDDRPHGGERVMHVTGPGGYCNHVFLALEAPLELEEESLHVRFYMRVARPLGLGHITFLAMHDAQTDRELRMGGQSEILMWNREIDDATLPELSPTGIDLSFAPQSNQWHCVEFAVDGPAGTLQTWVDGDLIPGLVVDGEPTADIDGQWHRRPDWHPTLEDFRIGWESYGGDPADVWFDDIVVDTAPIGCLP